MKNLITPEIAYAFRRIDELSRDRTGLLAVVGAVTGHRSVRRTPPSHLPAPVSVPDSVLVAESRARLCIEAVVESQLAGDPEGAWTPEPFECGSDAAVRRDRTRRDDIASYELLRQDFRDFAALNDPLFIDVMLERLNARESQDDPDWKRPEILGSKPRPAVVAAMEGGT